MSASMNGQLVQSEYLVLSRGQWDREAAKPDIETAIAEFYSWFTQNLDAGRFRAGSRLSTDIAMVSQSGIHTDGPFGEAKEVIGGYWLIVAQSLHEAANIAAENPCVKFGLRFEIRPLEAAPGSVYNLTNENPAG